MTKDELLKKLYFDDEGFGSIQSLYKEAKAQDKTITLAYVRKWMNENREQNKQLSGTNSFVAPNPNYEYQIDLFFINDLPNQEYKVGMVCIDIFTKYLVVVPIKSRNQNDVADGLIQCLNKMGKLPKFIYSDDETSLRADKIKIFLAEHKIQRIISRSHAAFAERAIRTFKDLLYRRTDHYKKDNPNQQWHKYIEPILKTYNEKSEHRSIGMTPKEAKKPDNTREVKLKMELSAKRNRKYPDLDIDDRVKIYTKRPHGAKERTPVFSSNSYEVGAIVKNDGLKFYNVNGRDYQRNELLLVR